MQNYEVSFKYLIHLPFSLFGFRVFGAAVEGFSVGTTDTKIRSESKALFSYHSAPMLQLNVCLTYCRLSIICWIQFIHLLIRCQLLYHELCQTNILSWHFACYPMLILWLSQWHSIILLSSLRLGVWKCAYYFCCFSPIVSRLVSLASVTSCVLVFEC